MISRRGILGSLLAAPAIIRTPGLLMPVRPVTLDAASLRDGLTWYWIGDPVYLPPIGQQRHWSAWSLRRSSVAWSVVHDAADWSVPRDRHSIVATTEETR